ncbi:inner membrane transporter RhtA [Herbihabitans rhizosphaerae]|uniref:Inner membrane transporter RhtA n=1 Tax=Herbihabitans rhizosphaerae TaxID=1872711 RepID=A0A4Q7KGT9_9PSEU|nr:EamA family transporter [Herbihabitans rhizosphaerae]RZS34473.1 inner membrane transporter RhtA [Herbihabitans rhizosphaerae]
MWSFRRSVTGSGIPAPLLFVIGGASMYVGAAVAVLLFAEVNPASVAWLRCLGAAIVLLAWRRPGREAWRGRAFWIAAGFGLVTAVMNIAIYEAIARLPLGTGVALEFAGPIAVAAAGSRTRRDIAAVIMVTLGVILVADVHWAGAPLGVVFALSAAACWAGYIVLGKRVADAGSGIDSLAVGFAVATVVLSPLAAGTGAVWTSPTLLLLGIGVGVLSTVVPYSLDQVVLRRLGHTRFALLLALLPVTASVIGFLMLAQVPSLIEALGILAVVVGLTLRSRGPEPHPDPP